MLSRTKTFNIGKALSVGNKIFLKLESEGKVSVFNYYYTQSSPAMYGAGGMMISPGASYSVEKYVIQKENGWLLRPTRLNFRAEMSSYFSNCPTLSEKIQNKEFRMEDLQLIVHYYNTNCQ